DDKRHQERADEAHRHHLHGIEVADEILRHGIEAGKAQHRRAHQPDADQALPPLFVHRIGHENSTMARRRRLPSPRAAKRSGGEGSEAALADLAEAFCDTINTWPARRPARSIPLDMLRWFLRAN